jgi:hypothetical protein
MPCDGLCFYMWSAFDEAWIYQYETCAMIEDPGYICGCVGTISGSGSFDGQIAFKSCTRYAT